MTQVLRRLTHVFAALDPRFAALGPRFAALDPRYAALDQRFAALVELTPEFIIVRETVHVGDHANNRVLATEYSNLRESLGLTRVDEDDTNEADEEDEE